MFEHTVTARFRDIDYAGRVFYGELFNYTHVAEEEWFHEMGYPIRELDEVLGVLFPLVHAEAEFVGQIELDDAVEITLSVPDVGERSFDVHASAYNATQHHEAFEMKTTRVCTPTDGGQNSCPIPREFRAALEPHLES